jgi:hypothetical protein
VMLGCHPVVLGLWPVLRGHPNRKQMGPRSAERFIHRVDGADAAGWSDRGQSSTSLVSLTARG